LSYHAAIVLQQGELAIVTSVLSDRRDLSFVLVYWINVCREKLVNDPQGSPHAYSIEGGTEKTGDGQKTGDRQRTGKAIFKIQFSGVAARFAEIAIGLTRYANLRFG
jgi:hypothetical protein